EAASQIFFIENSIKSFEGSLRGLLDKNVMDKKRKDEEDFRAKVMGNPQWKTSYAGAWDALAEAHKKYSTRYKERLFHSTDSQLSTLAMQIVQYVAESKKPDADRLPGYHEAQLESLRYSMLSPAPIYKGMEIARITGALEMDLAEMGPNDAFLKIVL